MDALTGLLSGPRAQGAFLVRSVLAPPWSLRIQDEAPLTLVTVLSGEAWLLPGAADPVHLRPGAVAIVRGPGHYTVADAPTTRPTVIIHPGQRTTTPEGDELCEVLDLGPRAWGNDADGPVTLLTGTYQSPGETGRLLLDVLPAVMVLGENDWDCPFLDLLVVEMGKNDAGQEVVLDRLLDLVLISTLRAWLDRPDRQAPAWYRAHNDPVVGTALRLMHEEPALPWTVASLAAAAGVSRAALARRFTDLVGVPPMAYLARWRLAAAADLLREPDATIAAVARKVGYGSAFALSAAFKRIRGVSPHQYRRQAAALDSSPATAIATYGQPRSSRRPAD